jgi:hypothetical protein
MRMMFGLDPFRSSARRLPTMEKSTPRMRDPYFMSGECPISGPDDKNAKRA